MLSKHGLPVFALMAVLFGLADRAAAQEPGERFAKPTVRVTGEATISVKPDQAVLLVGVTTQAATAQAAAADNATRLDAVLAELRKAFAQSSEIKTASYSLTPNYRYPREGGQPTIAGYTATNVVEIKTGDLKQLGKIIDVASQSGANNIQSLRFVLKDEQAARGRALSEAALKARTKADVLASALGLRVIRILRVEEAGGVEPRPLVGVQFAEARVVAAGRHPAGDGG